MKSNIRCQDVAGIEVMNITKYGLWLLTSNSELFISFQGFPQFLDASVSKIMKVEQPNHNLLHWPDLGIDLAIQSFLRSRWRQKVVPDNRLSAMSGGKQIKVIRPLFLRRNAMRHTNTHRASRRKSHVTANRYLQSREP